MACWKIVARGRVQGVNFRSEAKKIAGEMRLSGFVRNAVDGSVEIECSCSKEELALFAEKIKKLDWLVKVESLEITPAAEKKFDGFSIAR